MNISIMEAVGKIVEVNGDEAQALAITVVKGDASYTGIIGIDPLRMGDNAVKIVAAMQSAIDRELSVAKAIVKAMELAGKRILVPGGTATIEYKGKAKQAEHISPEDAEAMKGFDKLLEQIFGERGGAQRCGCRLSA